MTLTVEKAVREFKYSGIVLQDPDPKLTLEAVRDFYANLYPEIVSAAVEGPVQKGNKLAYEFRKAVGTKGMRVTLESTDKIVTLVVRGVDVPARIWEGTSDGGVLVHCYVTRIAIDKDADATQFDRELQEHRPPTPEVAAIPLRLIL